MTIRAAVFDLDGVVRHADTESQRPTEARHGIASDAIRCAAFDSDLLHSALSGEIGRVEWAEKVGAVVGSPAAAHEWLFANALVDADAVALVADVRAAGITVAVMTNGVDTLDAELDRDGLSSTFHHVFNSASTGLLKPDPGAFLHVCSQLGLEPEKVFFTDDSPKNVVGARTAGLKAFDFHDVVTTRRELEGLGALQPQTGSA